MTNNVSPSIVLDDSRQRDDAGIPFLLRTLCPEAQRVKLLHSGTGPTGEAIHARTFSVQVSLAATTEEMSTAIASRAEAWLRLSARGNEHIPE